jgi:single-strand DNA-binding protein
MPLPNITLNGNLTVDPEIRYLTDGTPVLSMRVACNERYKKDGEWVDGKTTFMKVNAWKKLAETAINQLNKGDAVIVHGKLKQNDYVDQKGDKRISFEVEADAIAKTLKLVANNSVTDYNTTWAQDKF